jgi:hypothetical protein
MPISECVNGCVTNDRLGLVRLANLTVTKVRQRMAREPLGCSDTRVGVQQGVQITGRLFRKMRSLQQERLPHARRGSISVS